MSKNVSSIFNNQLFSTKCLPLLCWTTSIQTDKQTQKQTQILNKQRNKTHFPILHLCYFSKAWLNFGRRQREIWNSNNPYHMFSCDIRNALLITDITHNNQWSCSVHNTLLPTINRKTDQHNVVPYIHLKLAK